MKHPTMFYLYMTFLILPTATMQKPTEQLPSRVIKILSEDRPREQAIKALQSITISESQINDLITALANHYYDGHRMDAAWHLDTPVALKWFSTPAAKEWFKAYQKEHSDMLAHNFIVKIGEASTSKLSRKHIFSYLDIGFIPNVRITGYGAYKTPLDQAFENKDLELFKRLQSAGADPNSVNTFNDMYIIERVARAKNIPFLKALIIAGANRNPILDNGQTLIHSLEEYQSDFNTTEYNQIIESLRTGLMQPESLREQSINELVKQIKDGKLKLENAKKRIPQDLHKALEKALQENK